MPNNIRGGAKGKSREDDGAGFDVDAKTISFTRRKRGRWNAEKRRGEEAHCFMCDQPTMVLTPKGDGGVLAHCEAKGCQARGWPMYRAATADGYDLSAPRSVTRKIADRERAKREVEDAWSALSRRGKAVGVSLGVLLNHDASRNLPVELDKIVAATGWSKSSVQRGIDDAVAAGLINRGRKTFSQGGGKGQINRYALANETVAKLIRKNAVQLTIGPDLLGSKLTTGGNQSRRNAGVGESTRISERDMPYESASPVVASPSPVGAVDASLGRWRNGGLKTGATVATAGAQAGIATALRGSERSHRGGDLQQGIHPSDHLNQASAASSGGDVGSTASAQPQRTASTHASAPHTRVRAHAPERMPAHPHTRATTPRWTLAMIASLGEPASGHSGADTAVAPSRQPKRPDRAGGQPAATPAISAAALEHEKIEREEKAARRGDTSDNGRNSKWAK